MSLKGLSKSLTHMICFVIVCIRVQRKVEVSKGCLNFSHTRSDLSCLIPRLSTEGESLYTVHTHAICFVLFAVHFPQQSVYVSWGSVLLLHTGRLVLPAFYVHQLWVCQWALVGVVCISTTGSITWRRNKEISPRVKHKSHGGERRKSNVHVAGTVHWGNAKLKNTQEVKRTPSYFK